MISLTSSTVKLSIKVSIISIIQLFYMPTNQAEYIQKQKNQNSQPDVVEIFLLHYMCM